MHRIVTCAVVALGLTALPANAAVDAPAATVSATGPPVRVAVIAKGTNVEGLLGSSFFSHIVTTWWGRSRDGVILHGCISVGKATSRTGTSCTAVPALRLGGPEETVDYPRLDSAPNGATFGFVDETGAWLHARLSPNGRSWSPLRVGSPPPGLMTGAQRASTIIYDTGVLTSAPITVSVPAPAQIRDISSHLIGSGAAAGYFGTLDVAVVGDGWYQAQHGRGE